MPPLKGDQAQLNVRVPRAVRSRLKSRARAAGITMERYAEAVLERAIAKEEAQVFLKPAPEPYRPGEAARRL